MRYPLFQPMIVEAGRYMSLWRLGLGLGTVFMVCLAWMVGVLWLLARAGGDAYRLVADGAFGAQAQTPLDTVVFLCLIIGLGIGTKVAAGVWQKRSLRSLMGRGPRVLRHFCIAAFVTWAVAALLSLISLPLIGPILPNLDLQSWLLWLPVALIAVALQTGSEELLFRGYIQSQLAARFRHPAVWLVVPALLFGMLHYLPTLPLNAGLAYVTFAALFGVMAGDLTARTGSIGAAWGFHFANNSIAILIIAADGSLTGLGLFRSGDIVDALRLSPIVLLDLAAMLGVWLLIRRLVTA